MSVLMYSFGMPYESIPWLRFGDVFGETKDIFLQLWRSCHEKQLPEVYPKACHGLTYVEHVTSPEYLSGILSLIVLVSPIDSHQQIVFKYNPDTEVPYYRYVPVLVLVNDHAVIY